MRRFVTGIALACLLAGTFSSTALAAKSDTFMCPSSNSDWLRVDRDNWWARTVAGFGVAGITVYESDGQTFTAAFNAFAVSNGYADGQAVKDFVFGDQWDGYDLNANGFVCMKDYPINRANPGYLFGGKDDKVPDR
jgi:hypothetical protein